MRESKDINRLTDPLAVSHIFQIAGSEPHLIGLQIIEHRHILLREPAGTEVVMCLLGKRHRSIPNTIFYI